MEEIDDFNIYSIRHAPHGFNRGSTFLINSEKNALIDTGTSLTIGELIRYLSYYGIEKLDYIALTHVHMDHSGGASFLLG